MAKRTVKEEAQLNKLLKERDEHLAKMLEREKKGFKEHQGQVKKRIRLTETIKRLI